MKAHFVLHGINRKVQKESMVLKYDTTPCMVNQIIDDTKIAEAEPYHIVSLGNLILSICSNFLSLVWILSLLTSLCISHFTIFIQEVIIIKVP